MGVSSNHDTGPAEAHRFTDNESESNTSGCECCNDRTAVNKCAIAEVEKQIDVLNALAEKYSAIVAQVSTEIAGHANDISMSTEIEESPVVDLEEWHDSEAEAMLCNMMTSDEEMESDDDSADGSEVESPEASAESMDTTNAFLLEYDPALASAAQVPDEPLYELCDDATVGEEACNC